MRTAYHADSALAAQALLEGLAAELDKTDPGAAASLREGMAETLTVLRPGCAAHRGPNPAVDQRGRVDDLDQPGPFP